MSKKILFIDSRIPHIFLGAGFPRANKILNTLCEIGFEITFYPLRKDSLDSQNNFYSDIDRRVKIISGNQYQRIGLEQYLTSNVKNFDYILISRPTNMLYIKPILEKIPKKIKNIIIIYDAEAIYALREIMKYKLKNVFISNTEVRGKINKELSLALISNKIIAVSKDEKDKMIEYGVAENKVYILSHCIQNIAADSKFENRSDILFIGSFVNDNSPNTESVIWFVKSVFPIIEGKINSICLNIVGLCNSPEIKKLSCKHITVHGIIENTDKLYLNSKVFIAPTRIAAGIPLKVIEAASKGIPAVSTSIVSNLLGWSNNNELLVADTPEDFAKQCIGLYTNSNLWYKISKNAKTKVALEYSEDNFKADIMKIFAK